MSTERLLNPARFLKGNDETEKLFSPAVTPREANAHIAGLVLERPLQRGWLLALAIAALGLLIFLVGVTWLFYKGVGVWGINIPVAWAFAITNFVWWIGIGHAGTFISAILFLLRQEWRTSINRFAEAMTLFAVACAGLFPILHLGRPWFFYWLAPYPNVMGLWPQFRSPLIWDFFAVLTYFTVSLMFWYVGLIPDLAVLRDRATVRWKKIAFGVLALGWRGSSSHWRRYMTAYLLLAGLATPLVISVHSIVSLDFTVAQLPGWHSTIFPPYFVAGAIFSGFAMVLTLAIPLRKFFNLQGYITLRHLDLCAKLLLTTGLLVAYGYMCEIFMAFYSGNNFERFNVLDRMGGAYSPQFWTLIFCNVLVPQLLWFKKVRVSAAGLFVISLVINVGMWLERFVIVVQSLSKDFLPSKWHLFAPTIWDWAVLVGSFGLFFFLFILFIRTLPVISISEMNKLAREGEGSGV